LEQLADRASAVDTAVRGRGLLQGLDCGAPGVAEDACRRAFERGLIVETSGPEATVIKLMPPLTIDPADLAVGLDILSQSLAEALAAHDYDGPSEKLSLVSTEVGV
jgi:diaminobutyrate-2-oxoglutarate transaminase